MMKNHTTITYPHVQDRTVKSNCHVSCSLLSTLSSKPTVTTGGRLIVYRGYQLCMILVLPIIQIFLVDDSTNRTQEPKSIKLATPLLQYENTQSTTATKDAVEAPLLLVN